MSIELHVCFCPGSLQEDVSGIQSGQHERIYQENSMLTSSNGESDLETSRGNTYVSR